MRYQSTDNSAFAIRRTWTFCHDNFSLFIVYIKFGFLAILPLKITNQTFMFLFYQKQKKQASYQQVIHIAY
jgi:hypothetical protein